jgi:hypothetical protein
MNKLTDAQKEQARSMFKDGKRSKEIIDFFKETYKIRLGSSTLSYILHGRKKDRKLSIKRRIPAHKEKILKPAENNDEFVFHVREAFSAFKKRFLREVETTIETIK